MKIYCLILNIGNNAKIITCVYINGVGVDSQLEKLDLIIDDYDFIIEIIFNENRWNGLTGLLGFNERDKLDELIMFGGIIQDLEAEEEADAIELDIDKFSEISMIGERLNDQIQAISLDASTGRLKVKLFNTENYIPIQDFRDFIQQLPS